MGKSLQYLDPEIAEPRIAAIARALTKGEPQTYEYSHDWDEQHWEFIATVTPLSGYNEVLVTIADKHLWQTEYWQAKQLG